MRRPAQQRLIDDAMKRDSKEVNFFGIPEKTRRKLHDLDVVKTVPTFTDDEKAEFRIEASALCDDLKAAFASDAPQYHLNHLRHEIESRTRKLFATKVIVT